MRARTYTRPDRPAPAEGGPYIWDRYAGMWVRPDEDDFDDEVDLDLDAHEERRRQRIALENEY
ncbi:hypothetical protein [Methylobacterium ajmalii]|uniref:hypothetical protein n=1 Tax=Methylobacterium ajmalii TaxID=2738439 RepID=UPI002F35954F